MGTKERTWCQTCYHDCNWWCILTGLLIDTGSSLKTAGLVSIFIAYSEVRFTHQEPFQDKQNGFPILVLYWVEFPFSALAFITVSSSSTELLTILLMWSGLITWARILMPIIRASIDMQTWLTHHHFNPSEFILLSPAPLLWNFRMFLGHYFKFDNHTNQSSPHKIGLEIVRV